MSTFTGESLVGKTYGRLTVVSYYGRNKWKKPEWVCQCACGVEKVVGGAALRQGLTISCGCAQRESVGHNLRKHGMYKHPIYKVWQAMVARCHNPNNSKYADYGGRGIYVCDGWRDFQNFRDDMLESWREGLELDRIRNHEGYSKRNCRWATRKQQTRNTRRNVMVEIDGVTKPLVEWVEQYGVVKYATVASRVRNLGWSFEKALTTPVDMGSRNGNAKA